MAGATGTAREIAGEVWSIYSVPSIRIPRNQSDRRTHDGIIYCGDRAERDKRILSEIEAQVRKGRPVLVGTRSVSSSEDLGRRLGLRGVDCEILNATRLAEEAAVIGRAGSGKRVTIATNMAGRGTAGNNITFTEKMSVVTGGIEVTGDTQSTDFKYASHPGVASFTGNNSTTTMTIASGHNVNSVLVVYNGVVLTPTTDYTISGTTLTLQFTPPTNAQVIVRYLIK